MMPGTYLDNARVLEGTVDFVELLLYEWNDDVKQMLFSSMDELLELDLEYTAHLPMNSSIDAKNALDFFEDAGFPILNYVLHPMKGWRNFIWNERVALENLKNQIVPYDRMVFDVGHHILGIPFPKELKSKIVEVHMMGVKDGKDHLPLNLGIVQIVDEFLNEDALINFEVFSLHELESSLRVWSDAKNVF